MSTTKEIRVPDIGDFDKVDVIEVLVSAGDEVEVESPLITLESDKATMDVPCPEAGVIVEVKVQAGDKVGEGDVIAVLEPVAAKGDTDSASNGKDSEPAPTEDTSRQSEPTGETQQAPSSDDPAPSSSSGSGTDVNADIKADLVVLGSGPGGYTAAFRAADLGLDTIIVERYPDLGGVCLNVGCIPSKALLHAARVIDDVREMGEHGVSFGKPKVDSDKLRAWKDSVVQQLTKGLAGLARQRKVRVIQGTGRFTSPHTIEVIDADGAKTVLGFNQAVIAAGSQSVQLPDMPEDPRVLDSTAALALEKVPRRMLVIGGGIIGLEMATVYHALGSSVTVVELMDGLMPGADRDIVRPLERRISKQYENIHTGTRVISVEASKKELKVRFEGGDAPSEAAFDCILVAVGRTPNGKRIGADKAGVNVDERGFIAVDKQMRTNVDHIFAIGDIVGQPMLAHKATHEGKVAAEVAAGHKSGFDARVIPSVAYTDPEVAWAGPTEEELKKDGREYGKGIFPWAASGRALGLGRSEGITKLLFDKDSGRIIAAGIVGVNAGDLIAEVALAIEMGADAQDLALTIHPHPTLSETICFAAEAYEGTITDLYIPKKKKSKD